MTSSLAPNTVEDPILGFVLTFAIVLERPFGQQFSCMRGFLVRLRCRKRIGMEIDRPVGQRSACWPCQ